MPEEMTIYRDAEGQVINIGPWQYNIQWVEVLAENGAPIMDALPNGGGYVPRMEQRALNPLPEGATQETAMVEVGQDGGLRVIE